MKIFHFIFLFRLNQKNVNIPKTATKSWTKMENGSTEHTNKQRSEKFK